MTTIKDGPASGQTLMLKRAPHFLRLVVKDGKWDALDQLIDQPDPDETIYVYRVVSRDGSMHINRAGGRGGFFHIATYEIVPDQPADEVLRNTQSWHEWCGAQVVANKL